jgi:predicted acylesterase/phospholipase RssA
MRRIGLALSGGGFRATLYHLGLVRFLRDAGVLPNVTHITSVSGGSILAAHLALHWDRYTGSANDFEAAAAEVIALVRLDVRNRIVRRFLLAEPVRWVQGLLHLGSGRRLTRAGLLEHHYRRYLFGDTRLSELPAAPQLHILATNISEGSLCSFGRTGLLIQRRQGDGSSRFDHVPTGLATVPMAVAASSAFPGFFPPLWLTADDVGAPAGTFAGHAFTDGAVFDNLGVRLFRVLERRWMAEVPLSARDFHDFGAVAAALRDAGRNGDETPLRRVAQLLAQHHGPPAPPAPVALPAAPAAEPRPPADPGDGADRLLDALTDLMTHYQFNHDPAFAALPLADRRAESLLLASRVGGRVLDLGDQVWLNRHLFEAAVHQATGRPGLRRVDRGVDAVLVSDVGKSFKVRHDGRAGGLLKTAFRASDILMDRVGQLEKEIFGETPGFLYVPITRVVTPEEDPTAPDPEVQRQTANIRTDLDRFTPLEVSCLVRHGYCVGRQVCKSRPDLFGAALPAGEPWDPVKWPPAHAAAAPSAPSRPPSQDATVARSLQKSSVRRIWTRLLDPRDWFSYLYVPVLVPLLVLLPYFVYKWQERAHRTTQLMDSIAEGAPELRDLTRLLDGGPDRPWVGVEAEEVAKLDPPDFQGFQVLQESRVVDMRAWKPVKRGDTNAWITVYRRLRVVKLPENGDARPFRIDLLTQSPKVEVVFPPQRVDGRLKVCQDRTVGGPRRAVWELSYDFTKVPPGEDVDLYCNYQLVGPYQDLGEEPGALRFPIQAAKAELTLWVLMPQGREYDRFSLIRYPTGSPAKVEAVKVATEYLASDYTILSFRLLAPKPGYTYEVRWSYKR